MLTASKIAQLYGLALRGDQAAAAYLTSHGFAMTAKKAATRPSNERQIQLPDTNRQGILPNPYTIAPPALDFSFFTVKSISHYEHHPNRENRPQLKGNAYQAQDDAPLAQPQNPANTATEYTQVFSKPVIAPLQLTLKRIKHALRHQQTTAQLDIPRLVTRLAKGQVVARLPPLNRIKKVANLTIYVDCGSNCHGAVQDAFDIVRALAQQYRNNTIYLLRDGPDGLWRTTQSKGWQNTAVPISAETGGLCLVITVLSDRNIAQWQVLRTRWKAKAIQPIWLSTRGQNNLKTPPPAFGNILAWGKQTNDSHYSDPLKLLTAVLLSCRWIDGALLRSLCQAMTFPAVCETDFWRQSCTYYEPGCDRGAVLLSPEQKAEYRDFLQALPPATLSRLSTLIETHLKTKSFAQLHEHRLHFAMLTGDRTWQHPDLQTSSDFMQSLGINIRQQGEHCTGNIRYLLETIKQWDGYLENAPEQVRATLAVAFSYGRQKGIADDTPPPTHLIDLVQAEIAEMTENKGATQTLYLYQKAAQLVAIHAETDQQHPPPAPWRSGKPNVFLGALHNAALAPIAGNANSRDFALFPNQVVNKPYSKSLTLKSTHSELALVQHKANDFYWAESLSISSAGVSATTEHFHFDWPVKTATTAEHTPLSQPQTQVKDPHTGCVIRLQPGTPQWLLGHQGDSSQLSGNAKLSDNFMLSGGLDLSISAPHIDEHGLVLILSCGTEDYHLRYLPPDSFIMGSPADEPQRNKDEQQHLVTIAEGFWIGATTISQALWQQVMGNNPSHFHTASDSDSRLAAVPVENVSWTDCVAFCQQLTQLCQTALPGLILHLPTEAQWEYACRAGTETPFHTGEQISQAHSHFNGQQPYPGRLDTAPPPRKRASLAQPLTIEADSPNPWGLHYMHGNVQEWCIEQHTIPASDPSSHQQWQEYLQRPQRTNHTSQIARGGSWHTAAEQCRSASRAHYPATHKSNDIGLRICALIPTTQSPTQKGSA